MSDTLSLILTIIIVVLVVLPPRIDPAIRLKEWVMKRRDRNGRS